MLFHHWSQKLIKVITPLTLIAANGWSISQPHLTSDDMMDMLVSTEWLSQHLDDPDLVVLDCTVGMEPVEGVGLMAVSGRSYYESGHIPTAGFADLMGDLCDIDSPFAFTLPTPEQFCAAMGVLGVGDESRVVLYDGNQSVWASRVWWMLRWVGFDRAAVLDGGLKVWTAEGRQLSTEPSNHQTKQLTPIPRPALIADRDEVFAAINDDVVSLIDAMPELHFQGEIALYDRPGHIPSASNISSMALLDSSGHYLPYDELATMCNGDRTTRVITYCGAGIAASSNAFILTRLGFTDVAVYIASLQEWVDDPANPLEVGKL